MIVNGDCITELLSFREKTFHLCITSPPYANQRKQQYKSYDEDDYVKWFCEVSHAIYRVLRDDGTFILNIKEHTVNGEKSTYVLELILALRDLGWLWTEEWIWHKKTAVPGKWPNRFKNAWERLLQFNKTRKFYMDQDAVKIPQGEWAHGRNYEDGRIESKTGTPFGVNRAKIHAKKEVYPSNVLYMPAENRNVGHPAAFPIGIPEFFIKLFSPKGGKVLDPFMGSGTTGLACMRTNREFVGIDISKEYCEVARKRLTKQ